MIFDPSRLSARERYFLMIGSIVPRPIAFVSTLSRDGIPNLAPFSYFNGVTSTPPIVSVSVGRRAGEKKDTWRNVEETGEFVINVVSEEIADPMVLASGDYPPAVDEFEVTGLTPVPSDIVEPPRVQESPINLECRLVQIVEVGEGELSNGLILGEVLRFHLRDDLYRDGQIDPEALRAVGRLGGNRYCRTRDLFERKRPKV